MKWICRAILFPLFMALAANAAIYYVAPTGSDANPGTFAQPWGSPGYAARAALQPGDTVYFRQGDYNLSGYVSVGRSGTASAPIVFASYPNETATMIYDAISVADPTTKIILYIAGSYVVLDRISMTQSQRSWDALAPGGTYIHGISVYAAGVTVKNCCVERVSGVGMFVSEWANNFLAEGCTITETRSHGFYVAGPDGIYRNNRLDGGSGYSNQQGIQIQYKSAQRNKIYGNLIANGQASGVVFSGMLSHNEVFNNVFVNCGAKAGGGYGYPLNFWHEDGPIGVGNKFYNNTVMGKVNSGIIAPTDGAAVEIYNNIFYPSAPVMAGGGPGYNIRSNIFWNVTGGVPAGNIQKDPLLVNPGGTTADVAKLTAGSPCIDAGLAPGAPGIDYTGTARPKGNGYDIGAFEFVPSSVVIRVKSGWPSVLMPKSSGQLIDGKIYSVDGRNITKMVSSGIYLGVMNSNDGTKITRTFHENQSGIIQ